MAFNKWNLWWLDQRLRNCWPASTQEAQACAYSYGLTLNNPRGQSSPTYPKPLGGNIPAEMTSLYIKVGDAHWVYCCWVKGCPEGPSSSHAAICSHMHHTHLGMKLTCSLCPAMFLTLMPSDGMASRHITLGPQIQLKECHTSV